MTLRLLLTLLAAVPALALRAGEPPPANLNGALRQLLVAQEAQPAAASLAERKSRLEAEVPGAAKSVVAGADANRVIVNVKLDGTQPVSTVRARLEALGTTVSAVTEAPGGGAGSVISARLPLTSVREAARAPGVFSLVLIRRPVRRVGKTTSQGAALLHADTVNAQGYTGAGLTVGVLSDSFDRTTPNAAADVAAGDLPGPGNPDGFTQPVYVLAESAGLLADSTDEGRAMLQIVHDVAPGARLAFAAVGDTPETFAARIRALRTDPAAHCDVLVDDIAFANEPVFSDGPIAQAIDDVVNSNVLAGRKVLYYTAAGNDGGAGWADDFRPVSDAAARAGLPNNNLQLSGVPARLTDGGFHNFDRRAGKVQIAQRVTVSGDLATVTLGWDDPSAPGLIPTTDYNVIVFDETGRYLASIDGGTDDNLATGTGDPLEIFDLPLARGGGDIVYQLAITRRNAGTQQATHLRYIASTTATFEAQFSDYLTPTISGHAGAPGVDAVAAYDYRALAVPEPFTSLGPVTIYFNRDGARLPTPEVRQQPSIAAPDNVDTSFFPADGDDPDQDGFPNFPGTSAAAPHVAGVAALLLQAAGGPGKLTAFQARALLQTTAHGHDLDPFASQAAATTPDGASATLAAVGDPSNNSAFDPKFFRLTFQDGAGRLLHKAVIDLGPSGLKFDPSADLGFPFTVGKGRGIGAQIVANFSGENNTVLSLKFPPGALGPGVTIEFGVDRDDAKTSMGGNSADLLAGATLKIKTKDTAGATNKGTGPFVNARGQGYSPVDGFGLIDAQAALDLLRAR